MKAGIRLEVVCDAASGPDGVRGKYYDGHDNLPERVRSKGRKPFTGDSETAVAEIFGRECPVIEPKSRIYGAGE